MRGRFSTVLRFLALSSLLAPLVALAAERAGSSYNVSVISPRTGETIHFTVHEPNRVSPSERSPLILRGSGFGGKRESDRKQVQSYLDAGFGVISFDQRGFGDSDARVSIMDPGLDGLNVVQVLDWAEEHLDWLAYKNGKLRLGTSGLSYGGGYQLALLGVDPKQRVQAMVPQITWNDLSYSLAPGNVPKVSYVALLTTAMLNGSKMGYEPHISEMLGRTLLTNQLNAADVDRLRYNSSRYFCDRVQRQGGVPAHPYPKVDALFMQGMYDVLFNINEAVANVQCLSRAGGDVRLMTYSSGHVLPSSPSGTLFAGAMLSGGAQASSCGRQQAKETEIAWFKAKLMDQPEQIASLPKVCVTLDTSGDSVTLDRFPVGGTPFNVPRTLINPTASGVVPVAIPLYTLEASKVIAGLPQARLRLSGVSGALSEAGDPVVFLGIGRVGPGGLIEPVGDQIRPVRGWGEHHIDLNGIGLRGQANETLYLLVYGAHKQFAGSSARFSSPAAVISGSVALPVQGGVPFAVLPGRLQVPPAGALPAVPAPPLPSLPPQVASTVKAVTQPVGQAVQQVGTGAANTVASVAAPPAFNVVQQAAGVVKSAVSTVRRWLRL